MSKLKIAIVGTGSISHSHIRAYLQNPDVELYAFCDINEERVKMMGEKYGVKRLYTDEAAMLRELPEIDAVSVCTWNSQHAPCTIMALNAGKHVLCEKPMATCAADAVKMKEAAEKNGKLQRLQNPQGLHRQRLLRRHLLRQGHLPPPQRFPRRLVRRQEPFGRRPAH